MIEALAQRLRSAGPARRAGVRLPVRSRLPSAGVLIAVLALAALLGGAWLWVRDSSLVAVKRVSVLGASGSDARQVRAALELAARNMTTLDVHMDQLYTAVAPFPVVKNLRVSTQFPHGMQIRVVEQIPVGVVVVAGRRIAVAGDGTLLHDTTAPQSLPVIPLRVTPGGSRLTEHDAVAAVAVLASAPYQLLGRVSQISTSSPHGLVAQLRSGPSLYFGAPTRLAAKWTAAVAVLADPGAAGAVYVDVTDPERPAAGGVGGASSAGGTAVGAAAAGSGASISGSGATGSGSGVSGSGAAGSGATGGNAPALGGASLTPTGG